MNQHVNRRSLAGISASIAFAGTSPAAPEQRMSELEMLIADYERLKTEEKRAIEAYSDLVEKTNGQLPKVVVEYGRRRIRDNDTGEVTYVPWRFFEPSEVDRHFQHVDWFPAEMNEQNERKKQDILRQLDEQEQAYDRARCDLGLTELDERADEAHDHRCAARNAICSFIPRDMTDVALKNTFLLRLLASIHDRYWLLSVANLQTVFTPPE